MGDRAQTFLVFLVAFAGLAWNTGRIGLATGWLDPVGHVAPQDEAVYSFTAREMARTGDWLTPRFLDRYVLDKPPLAYWLSAASVSLLGENPFAFRLPSILSGALIVALVFACARRVSGIFAGLAAALLAFSNPLLFAAARHNLMDAPLAACFAIAGYLLVADPALERRATVVKLGLIAGAAILLKSVAGLLVLGTIYGCAALLAARGGPTWRRLAALTALAAAVAAPWFLYQFVVHPHWFWREFFLKELVAYGAGTPPQTSQENHVLFYLRRLFETDPVLALAAVAGLAASLPALQRRDPRALVPVVWIGVTALGILAFHYRNAMYLVPAVPAAAILALRIPGLERHSAIAAALAALLLVPRIAQPDRPWGLPYRPARLPSSYALEHYAALQRPAELILVESDDQFTAALLPIPRLRYCFVDARPDAPRYALDFPALGITVTLDEFLHLADRLPRFRAELRAADLASDRPIATVILARTPQEVAALIGASPGRDFSLPREMFDVVASATSTHEITLTGGRVFLLAREPRGEHGTVP